MKEHRTADCVVVGVRWKAKPTALATLLLGLYEKKTHIDYVGSCAVAAGRQKEILELAARSSKALPSAASPSRTAGGRAVSRSRRSET